MPDISLALDTPDLAALYERASADRQFKAGHALVAELDIGAGARVLDIGCGTGLLAEYVAHLIGPAGSVVGIDPLPLRIEVAGRKARGNLSFQVGDANDLGAFAAASFDIVYLNAVFHWLPDKSGALGEIARVLKSRGRVGISTGSKNHPNPLHQIKARVLSRGPYNRYPEGLKGIALRVTADELRDLLDEAGFNDIRVEERSSVYFQPTAEDAIKFSEASSFGNLLGHLPPELRTSAREDIRHELERMAASDGLRFEGARLIGIASRH